VKLLNFSFSVFDKREASGAPRIIWAALTVLKMLLVHCFPSSTAAFSGLMALFLTL